MHSLHNIIFIRAQLKDAESAKDPRQLLAQGRGAGLSITEEEKHTLEKDIKEQEVLLHGYQKVRRAVLVYMVMVVVLESMVYQHVADQVYI